MSKNAPAVAVGAAFGAATVTALAQLGLASGLAIVIWREATPESWAAHLTWAAWLAAASTVIGGTIGARLADGVTTRITALLAAGVGGFVTAPLVAIPAMRFAESSISLAPFASAGIGVFAGIALTAAGMVSRAIAVNVSASIVLTWLLAGMATFFPVGGLDDEIRLGIWGTWRDLAGDAATGAVSLAPPLLLGSLLIGAITAWIAGGSDDSDSRVVGLSGAAGPLLLVVGYIAAGQPEVGVDPQWNGIWSGLYATVAGLLGSLLVTALRKRPVVGESSPPPQPATEPAYLRIDRDDAWAGGDADYQPPTQYQPTDAAPAHPAPAPVDYDHDLTEDLNQPIMPPAPEPEPVEEPEPAKPKKKAKKPRKPKSDAPPEPEPEPQPVDESESWVSGLKDPDNPDPYGFDELDEPSPPDSEPEPETKKRRFGRKKS